MVARLGCVAASGVRGALVPPELERGAERLSGARSCSEAEMEVSHAASGPDGVRERRGSGGAGRKQNQDERPQSGTNGLPKHSYWLDLWLFILFDLVLFIFVYLLPW